MMLTATETSTTKVTTYKIPGNQTLIEDATSSAKIRPVEVDVAEKDGEIIRFVYRGPRMIGLVAGRDSGRRSFERDEIMGEAAIRTPGGGARERDAEDLADATLALHLHETAHVITDPEEIRTVLAKALGPEPTDHELAVRSKAYG